MNALYKHVDALANNIDTMNVSQQLIKLIVSGKSAAVAAEQANKLTSEHTQPVEDTEAEKIPDVIRIKVR